MEAALHGAAKVVSENGHTWWKCPNCDQKLAELVGARVVIRVHSRLISLPRDLEQDQVCWRCGLTSVLPGGRRREHP
jgi:hypothetical protein